MNLRDILLEKKAFSDGNNTVYFSDRSLYNEPLGEEFWIFLDEGLRCGGTVRKIDCTKEDIKAVLLGCKKYELCNIIENYILEFEKR